LSPFGEYATWVRKDQYISDPTVNLKAQPFPTTAEAKTLTDFAATGNTIPPNNKPPEWAAKVQKLQDKLPRNDRLHDFKRNFDVTVSAATMFRAAGKRNSKGVLSQATVQGHVSDPSAV
jgi:hypothetical protein